VIDLKRLRQDPDGSRAALLRRRDPSVGPLLDEILDLDRQRREHLVRVEALKAERNAASEEVARRKRAGEPADDLMAQLKASGEEVKALEHLDEMLAVPGVDAIHLGHMDLWQSMGMPPDMKGVFETIDKIATRGVAAGKYMSHTIRLTDDAVDRMGDYMRIGSRLFTISPMRFCVVSSSVVLAAIVS